ncbi:MAG TPA: nucleotidyltransferase family protein [Terriglobia bacterium]|nr:nucleotidyltransferase family protein [Terriglobia bacterium]
MSQDDVAALILAAGESSRMGQDKALLDYRGKTFLEAIIGNLREAGIAEIVVVLGHHTELIQSTVDLDAVRVVLNPDYKRGQTSSLQVGLAAWSVAGPRAILLCLVDHPAVSPDVMRRILDHYCQSPAPVIIPVFRGKRGHPVLIGRELFAELIALPAQEGANSVIRKYQSATQLLEVEDATILTDVDDPGAYRKLTEG